MDLMVEERQLFSQGIQFIAGVDEVGRGCIAGPVFAAAVILPKQFDLPKLNDSKKISQALREKLHDLILQQALGVAVASIDVKEIDRINIFQASLKAMAKALIDLKQQPEMVLVDGKFSVPIDMPQRTLIKGDGRSASIAAASIIAKVTRDRFMAAQEKFHPGFSFSKHKGYGTAQHLKELQMNGVTPLHRQSFAPVRDQLALNKGVKSIVIGGSSPI